MIPAEVETGRRRRGERKARVIANDTAPVPWNGIFDRLDSEHNGR